MIPEDVARTVRTLLADVVARWRVQSHFSFADPVRHPDDAGAASGPVSANGGTTNVLSVLSDDVFGREVNEGLLYEIVKAQLASKRSGSAKTKNQFVT